MTFAIGLRAETLDHKTKYFTPILGSSAYMKIDGRLGPERTIEEALRLDDQWNRDRGLVAVAIYDGTLRNNKLRHIHRTYEALKRVGVQFIHATEIMDLTEY